MHQQECEFRFENLQPDTHYKFRIQAANSVGIGQFSNLIKFKTRALAPLPPCLDCVSTSYNSIKLKWSSMNLVDQQQTSSSKIALTDYQIVYNLEMMIPEDSNSDEDTFKSVYKGPLNVFKVTKLQESSCYLFRICALNEAGQSNWSDIYKFSTSKSPPIISKAPSVSEINQNSCLIEWQSARLSSEEDSKQDSLEYCLQLQLVKKDSDYKEIYRGDSCSYRLKDLEPNTEYNVRVFAVRLCFNNDQSIQRICSPSSPHNSFLTHKTIKSNIPNKNSQSDLAGLGSSSVTSNFTKQSSFLSKFMWPSFYFNINKSKFNEKITAQNNIAHSTVSRNAVQSSKKSNMSNRPSLTSQANLLDLNMSIDSKSLNRRKSDQYWAFTLIFVLVLIAFIIAYLVSSYYEVAAAPSSEF